MKDKKNAMVVRTIVMIMAAVLPAAIFFYFKSQNNFSTNNMLPKIWWPLYVDTITEADGTKYPDTVYHQVPPFSYTNCDGRTITEKDMDGKISVAELFFAECQSICPIMNENMSAVFNSVFLNDRFRIFSFTIDPERDTLESLKRYAKKYEANTDKWYFLYGNQDSTFALGRKGFKIPVDVTDSPSDFLHSDRLILIDSKRRIRGYYLGTDTAEVNKLKNDIILLLTELENPKKRKRKLF